MPPPTDPEPTRSPPSGYRMTVTLQRLRYFVAVAEELSFTRAAVRLHVSQPSLSEQVRRLEEDLGVTLLRRTTRQIELTEAGRAYLEDVRAILADLDRAHERAVRVQTAVASTVRIAYTASVAYHALPLILDELASARPDLEAVVLQRATAQAVEDVRVGDADLALVREFGGAPGLLAETVRREPLAAFMGTGHPLADRTSIRVDDLRGRTVVVVPAETSPGLHHLVERLCAARGFSPSQTPVSGVLDREPLLAHLARRPDRLFVGPSSIASVGWDGVVGIPIEDDDATLGLSAVWRDDGPSPAAQTALDAARRVSAAHGWLAPENPAR